MGLTSRSSRSIGGIRKIRLGATSKAILSPRPTLWELSEGKIRPHAASFTSQADGHIPKKLISRDTSDRKIETRHGHQDMHFQIHPEVREAVYSNRPVVALETTIYTHGFPYPDNVALALDLEEIVRKGGGIPATIGVLEGVARVGMTTEELRRITAAAKDPATMKVSRRDLPYILGLGIAGRKLSGGTTIAGTMMLAHRAGIKVFGTGGLGGVHRGGQDTMDVSADLTELGRTPVAVISSGCKSFLDLRRTLEYLETQGAGVFTFADGRTGNIDFPAFYTRDSGVKSPMVVQNEKEAAAMILSQAHFRGSSGLLFANPIPEKYSIPKNEIDSAIDQAVQEAAEQGFHGHSNTPFILSRIKELTKGNSIPANKALIESNVAVATRVAVELSQLQKYREADQGRSKNYHDESSSALFTPITSPFFVENKIDLPEIPADKFPITLPQADITVYGSIAIDLSCNYMPSISGIDPSLRKGSAKSEENLTPQLHTSNIATITPSVGGVGHNVALAAQRASGNLSVRLCSYVADDLAGATVLKAMKQESLDASAVVTLPANEVTTRLPAPKSLNRTAQYVAINDAQKDLVMAMADMSIFENPPPLKYDSPVRSSRDTKSNRWTVVDANWTPSRIRHIMSRSSDSSVAFEPVSVAKSAQLFQPHSEPQDQSVRSKGRVDVFPRNILDLATPNQYELAAMHSSAKKHEFFESDRWWQIIDALGIPSSGARDRFVSLTTHQMTDEGIPLQNIQLLPFIPTIITKLGADGVLFTKLLEPNDDRLTDPASAPYILSRTSNGSTEVGGVYMRLFPAMKPVDDVVSVNGVGDTFLGVLVAGLAKGIDIERMINVAQRGAVMTLKSSEAVSPQLGVLSSVLERMANEPLGIAMDEDLLATATH